MHSRENAGDGSLTMTPWRRRLVGSGAVTIREGQGRLQLPLPGWPAVAVHVGDDRHQAASRLVMISGAAGDSHE